MTLKVRILQSLTRLFIILVFLMMSLFSEKMLIFDRCISGLMSNSIKKSWTVSSVRSPWALDWNVTWNESEVNMTDLCCCISCLSLNYLVRFAWLWYFPPSRLTYSKGVGNRGGKGLIPSTPSHFSLALSEPRRQKIPQPRKSY